MDDAGGPLYHGTSMTAWESIRREGLRPGTGIFGAGVYLATGEDVARRYAAGHVTPPWGRETEAVVLAVSPAALEVRRFQGTTVLVGPVPADQVELVAVVRAGEVEDPSTGLRRGLVALGSAARAMTEAATRATVALGALDSEV